MNAVTAPVQSALVLHPDTNQWRRALSTGGNWSLSGEALRFREELGLSVDRPIVMSGHQAQVWHPGILAKYLATSAAADRYGAAPVWLCVDQDTNDPWSMRYPVTLAAPGKHGETLGLGTWIVNGAGSSSPRSATASGDGPEVNQVPSGRQPSLSPAPLPSARFASAGVREGLERVRDVLAAHRSDEVTNAAEQIDRAIRALVAPLCAPMASLMATRIARTTLFAQIVRAMRRDPGACIESYNAAALAHPHARIAPLKDELPLWHIAPAMGSVRRRVRPADLGALPVEELAPRALLMTGLVRWAGCELFVHGLGGGGHADDQSGGYDRVTSDWLRAWLGVELAPLAVVSATLRLDLGLTGPLVTSADIASARWKAHAAKHRPEMLGDEDAARTKSELVAQIQQARRTPGAGGDSRSGDSARSLYLRMHALLEATRASRSGQLATIADEAERLATRSIDASIASDRTWAFPLYSGEQLRDLKDEIVRVFERDDA